MRGHYRHSVEARQLKSMSLLQAEYERQAEILSASHQKALAQCREEMMRLVDASDVNTVPVNEELIRKKYSKETKQIKVFNIIGAD